MPARQSDLTCFILEQRRVCYAERGAPAPSKLPKNLLDYARMSDRRLTPIRQLVALGMLLAAVITLAIAGALNSVRSSGPQLASQK